MTYHSNGNIVMDETISRIVTGEDSAGNSIIVQEDQIASIALAGIDLIPLWGVPELPVTLPATGVENPGNARGQGIVRVAVGIIPPHCLVGAGSSNAGHLHFDADGFHRTDSVDVAYVVAGPLVLRVPGAEDRIVEAGGCIVQNGASHAWRNDSDEKAVVLWVWIKGDRQSPS